MRPLVPSPGGVPLAFARTPYAEDVYRPEAPLPFGLTVSEILRTIPDLPDRAWTHGVVCLNGEPVPREWWGFVRLTEKPVPVTVTVYIPLGFGGGRRGGGGRKSTFSLIASIALIAATTAISAGTLGPAGLAIAGGYLAAGSTSAAFAAATVGIVGGLAIAALTPPPTFDKGSTADERRSGSASASGNQLEPGGVIPRVIGTFRASPSFACLPLVDIDGDDEVVEAVLAMAGPHKWEKIRIDGIPIDNGDAFTYETKEGWDDDTPLTLVTRQGFTEAPLLELSGTKIDPTDQVSLQDQVSPGNSVQQWHTLITRRSPDEAWLSLLFPEGGFRDDGVPVLIPIRIRMRVRGMVTWINFPEIHFRWDGSSQFKRMIKFKWTDDPATMPEPLTEYAPVHAYKTVPAQDLTPVGLGGWEADSYFSGGAGDNLLSAATFATSKVLHTALYEDRVEFYLGSPTDPFSSFSLPFLTGETVGGLWEIQVKRGHAVKGSAFTPETYVYDDDFNGVFDFFGYYTDGTFRIFSGQKQTHSKVIVARIASVWNTHPIGGTGLALLAVKARSRSVQNVSALLSGYVPDWDGSSWATWTTTSNPAPHYRYILAGGVTVEPLPGTIIDDDSLVAWRTRCATDGLRCDMIADGMNTDELLKVVAANGFARSRQSELWGVAQDYDRSAEAPVQIFTQRNLSGFRFQKVLPLTPHALRARYRDRDRDYEDAPALTVYDEGYSADGAGDTLPATRLEEITYVGGTSESAVAARALFDLKQARLRSGVYYAGADAEALVATKGDLVGVQHDILARQAGSALVKEKILSGDDVVGLRLDSKIPTALGGDFFSIPDLFTCPDIFALTGTTGIAIRLKDGTGVVVAQELSDPTGETDEVAFDTPLADPGDDLLGEGCLVASGELGQEYLRLILADVRPEEDLRASLAFVDEAPELWPAISDVDTSFDESFDSSFG